MTDRALTSGEARQYTLLEADRRPYLSPVPGRYGGHRRGRRYGRLDCPAAAAALARGGYVADRVFFADEQTAIAAGYRPCAVCLPSQYQTWKTAAKPSAPGPAIPDPATPSAAPGAAVPGRARPSSGWSHGGAALWLALIDY